MTWHADLAVQAVADFGQLIDRAETRARSFDAWNPVAAMVWGDRIERLRRDCAQLAEDVGERLAARL